ncbi:MAG: Gx transporter family protein [Lachnospiraceae bacterium]|nr:Gx transporter family protein [Lachnospiraceae bacterium]
MIKRLPMLALFTATALMIYCLESLLPTLIPVPGIKLGLANVVTLVVIKRYGARDALLVLLARILLSCFFYGQFLSLLYSLCGGLFCMLITWLINSLLRGEYLYLTSIFGAIAHNLAQLLVAYLITKVPGVLTYLPFLMISAIITGLFTGLCAHFTLRHLPASARS